MRELDRPLSTIWEIWYQIGDGPQQLHILARSDATLRRDRCTTHATFTSHSV
jgi:hypothetical protein